MRRAKSVLGVFLSTVLLCCLAPWPAYAGTGIDGDFATRQVALPASAVGNSASLRGDSPAYLKVLSEIRVKAIDSRPEAYAPSQVMVVYQDANAGEAKKSRVLTIPSSTGQRLASVGGATKSFDDAQSAREEGQAIRLQGESSLQVESSLQAESGQLVQDAFQAAAQKERSVSLIDVPDGMTVGEAVIAAEQDPSVAYAQPNYRYYALEDHAQDARPARTLQGESELSVGNVSGAYVIDAVVNDPIAQNATNDKTVENQWWLNAVRAPEAWEYARCEGRVAIAVLDTGINFNHEDLANNILAQYAWDATRDEPLTESPTLSALSHGSHVAGIAAAEANNGVGIAGASYNAAIVPVAVFEMSAGRAVCDDATLVKAYNYLMSDPDPTDGVGQSVAQRTNLHVVNMSLGGYAGEDEVLRASIAEAQNQGILTVAAGGNGDDNGNPITDRSYPSDYDEVMSVVALKDEVERSYWSDYNECKDIAAPGVDIWSTWYTGNDYYCTSGTSMAAPLVAGCAALLWEYDPLLTVQEVKEALYSTAVDLGPQGQDSYYGWGRIDIAAAIESLGTAHVTAERQTMGRTGTQQLKAQDVRNASAGHEWSWSVSDASVASIAQDGVLTALRAGTVVVNVQAVDDPSVSGHISITVTEITVPGTVSVKSDGVNHTVTLEWNAADAAKAYSVRRSADAEGSYEQVGEVNAELGMSAYRYIDEGLQPGQNYYYKIVPLGRVGADEVEGAATKAVKGYFTEKSALHANIARAEELIDAAVVSEDGSDVDALQSWTTQESLDALQAEVSKASLMLDIANARQAVIDSAANKLANAITAYTQALKPGLKNPPAQEEEKGSGSSSNSSDSNGSKSGQGADSQQSSAASSGAGTDGQSSSGTSSTSQTVSLAKATVTLVSASKPYNGTSQRGAVKSVVLAGTTLKEGVDYTVSAKAGKTVGSYAVTVTGTGAYSATAQAVFKIVKAANTVKVRSSMKSVKLSVLKKKARTVSPLTVLGAKGKVTFAKKAGSKYLSVNKTNGKVTVAKGAKKGTFFMKVRVVAAGSAQYKKASKTVTVKVTVK